MMQIKDIEWKRTTPFESDIHWHAIAYVPTQYGIKKVSLSVVDRMTGFGHRDIETGLRIDGAFWLASGYFDIRDFGELSIEEAVEKIKEESNNCRGFINGESFPIRGELQLSLNV
jgi:hypothetical protein